MWKKYGKEECSHTIALGIKAANSMYQTHIKTASDVLDRMLVLLMGDDYDKSFTEAELLPFEYWHRVSLGRFHIGIATAFFIVLHTKMNRYKKPKLHKEMRKMKRTLLVGRDFSFVCLHG